jgi:hypothetical protein
MGNMHHEYFSFWFNLLTEIKVYILKVTEGSTRKILKGKLQQISTTKTGGGGGGSKY